MVIISLKDRRNDRIYNRLLILAIFAFISPLLLQLTSIWIFKISDDVVFFLLLIDSLVAIRKNRIRINLLDKTSFLVILIFSIYVLIEAGFALINNNSPLVVLLQLRVYKYLFLYIILYYYNNEDVFTKIYKIVRFIAYLSVPISIIQRVVIDDPTGDVITGMYGYNASGIMTLYLLILYFAEFSKNLSSDKKVIGWDLLYFVPISINETKIAFILIPVFFLVSILIARKNFLKNLLSLLILFSVLMPVLGLVYERNNSHNILDYFNTQELDTYLNQTGSNDIGRLLKIQMGYDIIKPDPLTTLFGFGIGAGYVGKDSGEIGQIAGKYNDKILFGATKTQLFDSLIDTGVFGVTCQFIFIGTIFFKIVNLKINPRPNYYYVAIFSLLVWFFGMFYSEIMIQSNLFFFMILAIYMTYMNLPMNKET